MNVETTTDVTTTDVTTTDASTNVALADAQTASAASTRPAEGRRVRWFRPPIDVFESDEAFRVDMDVPGVSAEHLELTVDNGVLTLEALRDEGRGWRRQLRLTDGIDVDGIEAHLEAGVLSLTLPKAETAKARRIEVRGG